MFGATRRSVLGYVAGAAMAGVGGLYRSAAGHRPDGPRSRRLRSEASTAAGAANLVIYRDAVRYMRTLPSANRRSWAYQVSIHNNWCPHRNWLLLPWHREYLLALERIINSLPTSEVPNAPNFAMPYWNWTKNRKLPIAFTVHTNA